MAAQFKHEFTQNLRDTLKIHYCPDIVFTEDNLANVISVALFDGETPYNEGGTVSAKCITPDGRTVPITNGTIDGNIVKVALIKSCVAIPGQIQLFVKLTSGEIETTIFAGVFSALQTETDKPVDPGDIISGIDDLINRINTAIDRIPADYTQVLNAIAGTYSASKTYAVGDYVWYPGTSTDPGALYRCTTAITTAESWNTAHWTAAVFGDDVASLKSALTSVVDSQYSTLFSKNTISGTRYTSVPVSMTAGNYHIEVGDIQSSDTDATQSLIMFNDGDTTVLQLLADRVSNYTADIVLPASVNTIWFFASTSYNNSKNDTFTYSDVRILNPNNALNNRLSALENKDIQLENKDTQIEASVTDAKSKEQNDTYSILNNQYVTAFSQSAISGTRNKEVSANIPAGLYKIEVGNIQSSDTDDTQSLIMFSKNNVSILQVYADRISNWTADIELSESIDKIVFFAAKTYNNSAYDTFDFSNVVITNPDNQLNNRLTEIEKTKTIVDNTLRTRNLFNVATYTEKKQFNGQGAIIDSALTGISDYIPVESGRDVYFSKGGRPYKKWDISFICEYDAEKAFIQRIDHIAVDYVYTVPVNVAYIRICILDSLADVWQCEYDGITGYMPYYLYDAIDYIDDDVLMASVNMFGSIAGIGDSYTAGSSQTSGGTMVNMTNQSYIATMGKRAGVDWYNYGVGGATVGSYLVNANGLLKVLAENPHDLYIINLGQNDVNQVVTIGTIADINDSDYTQNPDTFYGNYGKLIAQLQAHAPNAKIILVKSWIDGKSWNHNIDYQSYDPAIQEIAEHYGIPCIAPFDDRLFCSYFYSHYKLNGHPTPMGYTAQGLAMERLFSRCVMDNPEYFIDATVN